MIIEELSKRKLAELDEMFEKYQDIKHLMASREFELRYPWTPSDMNIGGGRSTLTADAQERTLEVIQSDPRMIYLNRLKTACERAVSKMNPEQLELYKQRYDKPCNYTWSDMTELTHYSRIQVYRKRYAILSLLAKEIGWMT